tara:strand:+ start:1217 stop:2191 length:975 start_codon:yes stop_codon:yes gene_type:complete
MALDNTIATEPLLNRIIKQEYHNPEDYNFPVTWAIPECSTVTYENDDGTTQVIMSDEMRHLVNTRNKCVVGTHKSKYVEQLHEPLVNNVLDVAHKIGAGKVVPNIRVYENGKKLKGEVFFPDTAFTVRSGMNDTVCFKIEFGNSYDGTWKLGIKAMALRLACLNGMCHHQAISGAVLKHTANANYDGVIEAIKQSTQLFIDSEETYNRMVEVKHKETTVMKWFRNYLCFDNQGGKDKVNETQSSILYNTLGKYRSELGGNAWATYNTMTDWATHTPVLEKVNFNPYRNESPVARINDTNRRNNKITKMLTALSKGDNDKFLMTA